jgi:Ni,Fe-hydrogenase I small subunit
MGKEQEESISSFICYNCNEKNFFDKRKFIIMKEGEMPSEMKSTGNKVKEVSIECKSCRESNNVTIEY